MNLPPPIPPSFQDARDDEHLKLLSIGYYILAILSLGGGLLLGIFYACMGPAMRSFASIHPDAGPNAENMLPASFTWTLVAVGTLVSLFSIGLYILFWNTGKNLREKRNRTLCQVVAGLICLSVPLGTLLGVFTFLVLGRPSVMAKFHRNAGLLSA